MIVRALARFDVALVGVNQGRLGFLTDISTDNMLSTIGAMLDGVTARYGRSLDRALRRPFLVIGGAAVLTASAVLLFLSLKPTRGSVRIFDKDAATIDMLDGGTGRP